jgi:tetratricopeptide (TPR) repeat protein
LPLLAAALLAGCFFDRAERHLNRATALYYKGQYQEATVECRRVLERQPGHPEATRILALSLYQLRSWEEALHYLVRARNLMPDDLEIRLKIGQMYLAGRQLDKTWREAQRVLEMDPNHHEALTLAARSAARPDEIDAAIGQLERHLDRHRKGRYGPTGETEIRLDLGRLHFRKGDREGAERVFRQAVAEEPESAAANLALAVFLSAENNPDEAERALVTAAETAAPESPAPVKLAELYLRTGRLEEARRQIDRILAQDPESLPARRLLAAAQMRQGQPEEAEKTVDGILATDADPASLLFKAEKQLDGGDHAGAAATYQKALEVQPRNLTARYGLARSHARGGDAAAAKGELQRLLTMDATYVPAILLLADLNIRSGDVIPAITDLERLVERQPGVAPAWELLGTAYLKSGRALKAVDAQRRYVELAPKDPRGPYLLGIGLKSAGSMAEARRQFERALALAPGKIEPLAELCQLLIADDRGGEALELARRHAADLPRSAPHAFVLGDVLRQTGQPQPAEEAYLTAARLDSDFTPVPVSLARLYAATRRWDDALAQAERALKHAPDDVDVLLLVGYVHRERGDADQAREVYERIIKLNPHHAAAANNLALAYARRGQLPLAVQLAQVARKNAPDDPGIADTLGWLLYQRGDYSSALSLLLESATQLPNHAEIQFHLGMTYAKLGNWGLARNALNRALALDQRFPGADDARRVLEETR